MTNINTGRSFLNERLIRGTAEDIYAAFENAATLAEWWGPDGFTNTFERLEFQPGGMWIFTMHGPNGVDYANECVFLELEPASRIVLEHNCQPWFRLTVLMAPEGANTKVTWIQEFESEEMAAKLRDFCQAANEQVLDRLQAVLSEG